jgi:hypothetical protein
MNAILWSWAVSAAALLGFAALLGLLLVRKWPSVLGILIDNRGRFSLNHTQLVVWSIVVISLIAGVFFGRLLDGVAEPLDFTVPDRVLGLLGVSVGAGVTAGAVKSAKAAKATARRGLATHALTGRDPFPGQMFLLEEGEYADEVLDVSKFQGFAITIVLVVAYVAMAINSIVEAKTAGQVTSLPDISGTFLVLLGISYGGYVGGKLPAQSGQPSRAVPIH